MTAGRINQVCVQPQASQVVAGTMYSLSVITAGRKRAHCLTELKVGLPTISHITLTRLQTNTM